MSLRIVSSRRVLQGRTGDSCRCTHTRTSNVTNTVVAIPRTIEKSTNCMCDIRYCLSMCQCAREKFLYMYTYWALFLTLMRAFARSKRERSGGLCVGPEVWVSGQTRVGFSTRRKYSPFSPVTSSSPCLLCQSFFLSFVRWISRALCT